jgi:hypothetical protein
MFDMLCGSNSRKHVVIATSMWERVKDEVATRREDELDRKHFQEILENGSRIMRFHNSFASAWDIIDVIIMSRHSATVSLAPQIAMAPTERRPQLKRNSASVDQFRILYVLFPCIAD